MKSKDLLNSEFENLQELMVKANEHNIGKHLYNVNWR